MTTLEVFIEDQATGAHWRDEIPDHELKAACAEASAHGCTLRVMGEIGTQRQLATMENNGGVE